MGYEKLGVGHLLLQNINSRLIPTAEVTSLIEQTTKARITGIYLFFKKTNFFGPNFFGNLFFKKTNIFQLF